LSAVSKRTTTRHRALIVEDDVETAHDLAEIVKSIGCESVVVPSREQATSALRTEQFCFVLLDLQIKDSSRSIKGHVEHGKALLREIRQSHGERSGRAFWLPVLIVSGFAREVPEAVEVMKDGATDLIQKPLNSSEVSDKVRAALEASGRVAHDSCLKGVTPYGPNDGENVVITIPGERVRRRTVVTVGRMRIELADSSLRVLLRLMVAHSQDRGVHKRDLGASDEQGFKGISILRNELKPALGRGVNIVKNDHHGNYRLSDQVRIGHCATHELEAIGDQQISDLAKRLQAQSKASKPKV
jgi:DNA-binding response OmpR family regulator